MTLVTQLSAERLGRAGLQGTHTKGSSVISLPGLGVHGHNTVPLTQFVQLHGMCVEEGDTWKLWSPQIVWDPLPPSVQVTRAVQATERKVHKICELGDTATGVKLSKC